MSSDLVGRDDVIASIEEHLATHGRAWIAGVAGVGKTRLAHELLRRHGGVWISLAACRTPEAFASAVIAALRCPLRDTRADQVLDWAHQRGVLTMFLDNVDDVTDAALEWMDARKGPIRLIATARTSPHREFETLVAPLLPADAREMFLRRVPAMAAAPTDEDEEAMAQIVAAVGGLPLAIGLAAGRLGLMSLGEIAAELEADLLRDPAAAEHGVATSLDRSLVRIGVDGRAGIEVASIFAGSFEADSFRIVAGLADSDAVLATLCVHNLVAADALPQRWRVHPLLRQIVRARMGEPRLAALTAVHARRFGDLGARESQRILDGEPDRGLAAVERDDLDAVARRAIRGEVDLIDGARAALFLRCSDCTRGSAQIGEMVDALRRGAPDSFEFAMALHVQFDVSAELASAERLDEAAGCFRRLGLPDHAAFSAAAAAIARLAHRYDEADIAVLDAARAVVKHPHDRLRVLRGLITYARGRSIDQVLDDKRALANWAREQPSGDVYANALRTLAVTENLAGLHDDALAHIDAIHALGDAASVQARAYAEGVRAISLHLKGELAAATAAYIVALTKARALALGGILDVTIWQGLLRAELGLVLESDWIGIDSSGASPDARWAAHLASCLSSLNARTPPPEAFAAPEMAAALASAWDNAVRAVVDARRLRAAGEPADAPIAKLHAIIAAWGPPPGPGWAHTRLVPRLLRALVDDLDAANTAWRVAADGTGFASPGGDWVDIRTRKPVARALARLLRGRCDRAAIVEAAWPGESLELGTERNRVGVLMSTLRKLGFSILVTEAGGWAIDAAARVTIVSPA